jgi:hypothetical protein
MKSGMEVRPSFSVSQHLRNKEIIFFLQKHFKCGGVRYSRRDRNYKYEVRSVSDLIDIIIPHFDKYPLKTSKKEEFDRFKAICGLIHSNQHLNRTGLLKILELSEKLNVSGNKKFNRNDLLKKVGKMKV